MLILHLVVIPIRDSAFAGDLQVFDQNTPGQAVVIIENGITPLEFLLFSLLTLSLVNVLFEILIKIEIFYPLTQNCLDFLLVIMLDTPNAPLVHFPRLWLLIEPLHELFVIHNLTPAILLITVFLIKILNFLSIHLLDNFKTGVQGLIWLHEHSLKCFFKLFKAIDNIRVDFMTEIIQDHIVTRAIFA